MRSAASRSRRSVSSTCASQASRSSLLAHIFFLFPTEKPPDPTKLFENIVHSEQRGRKFIARQERLAVHAGIVARSVFPRKTFFEPRPVASLDGLRDTRDP